MTSVSARKNQEIPQWEHGSLLAVHKSGETVDFGKSFDSLAI
jgi:hypothetical protein